MTSHSKGYYKTSAKTYNRFMDIFLLILGIAAVVTGILGSILPFLPGPPITWVGLLLLYFSGSDTISLRALMITGIITLIIAALDYLLPVVSTKRFGGTRYGRIGATLGTIIGLFFAPLGIIIGP